MKFFQGWRIRLSLRIGKDIGFLLVYLWAIWIGDFTTLDIVWGDLPYLDTNEHARRIMDYYLIDFGHTA